MKSGRRSCVVFTTPKNKPISSEQTSQELAPLRPTSPVQLDQCLHHHQDGVQKLGRQVHHHGWQRLSWRIQQRSHLRVGQNPSLVDLPGTEWTTAKDLSLPCFWGTRYTVPCKHVMLPLYCLFSKSYFTMV